MSTSPNIASHAHSSPTNLSRGSLHPFTSNLNSGSPSFSNLNSASLLSFSTPGVRLFPTTSAVRGYPLSNLSNPCLPRLTEHLLGEPLHSRQLSGKAAQSGLASWYKRWTAPTPEFARLSPEWWRDWAVKFVVCVVGPSICCVPLFFFIGCKHAYMLFSGRTHVTARRNLYTRG